MLWFFHVGYVVWNGQSVLICYISMSGFHIKVENKKFTTDSLQCQQNLKFDYFSCCLADNLKIAPKSRSHLQCSYFSLLTNYIIDLWCCCCHHHFFNSLICRGACSVDYNNATEVDHFGALSLLWIWYNIHSCTYIYMCLVQCKL